MLRQTKSQRMAQEAYKRVSERKETKKGDAFKEYVSFARRFPSLLHSCGLVQAVVFANTKDQKEYIDDLVSVLSSAGYAGLNGHSDLEQRARTVPVPAYHRLARDALRAAEWLKRYAEAFEPGEGQKTGEQNA